MSPEFATADVTGTIPRSAVASAVLVLLSPITGQADARQRLLDWEVLLIRRAHYPGVHSGQIALPGGKREAGDSTLWKTACREAFEEVGVAPGAVRKLGALTRVYVGSSNHVIHPFVGMNLSALTVVPAPREVADYKQIPLRVFNPAAAVVLDVNCRGGLHPAPAWQYEDYTIWGATAMILAELYRLVENGGLN